MRSIYLQTRDGSLGSVTHRASWARGRFVRRSQGHLVGGEGGAHVPFAHPFQGTPRESKMNNPCPFRASTPTRSRRFEDPGAFVEEHLAKLSEEQKASGRAGGVAGGSGETGGGQGGNHRRGKKRTRATRTRWLDRTEVAHRPGAEGTIDQLAARSGNETWSG